MPRSQWFASTLFVGAGSLAFAAIVVWWAYRPAIERPDAHEGVPRVMSGPRFDDVIRAVGDTPENTYDDRNP